MANNLPTEKKVLAVSMLAEGSSIRSIERITGVHRDPGRKSVPGDQQYGEHPKQVGGKRSRQAHDCRLRIRHTGNLGVRAPQENPRLHVIDLAPYRPGWQRVTGLGVTFSNSRSWNHSW